MRNRGEIAKPLLPGKACSLTPMRPLLGMHLRWLLLAGLMIVGPALMAQDTTFAPPDVPTDPEIAAVDERLVDTVLPSVNLIAADVADALRFLNAAGKAHDPAHKGFHIVLDLSGPPGKSAPTLHRSITIQLENTPLADLLGYVAQQANLECHVGANAIVFRPKR
jgi:hypothetical protein